MKKIPEKDILTFFANKQVIVYNEPIENVRLKIKEQIEQNESDINLKLVYIQILYQYSNEYIEAMRIIKDILMADKENIDARLDLVTLMTQYNVGSKQNGLDLIEECIQLDDQYWRTYFIQIKFYDTFLYNDSFLINKMKLLMQKFPNNPWLTVYYWQIIGDDFRFKQKVDLDFILQSQYLDQEMLRRLGYFLQSIQEKDLALECEKRSLELNPKGVQTLNNYGYSLRVMKNDYQSCIELCKRALELHPTYQMVLTNLGTTYQYIQQFELSNACFIKNIQINDKKPSYYINLISNYYNLNQRQKEFYYAQKGIKRFPRDLDMNIMYLLTLNEENVYENKEDIEEIEKASFQFLNLSYHEIRNEYSQYSQLLNNYYD